MGTFLAQYGAGDEIACDRKYETADLARAEAVGGNTRRGRGDRMARGQRVVQCRAPLGFYADQRHPSGVPRGDAAD